MNKLFNKRLVPFFEFCLRGSGQVIFQNRPLSGLFFLAAIFMASCEVGFAALIGLIVSTFTGWLLRPHSSAFRNGLYGYDGLLVGAMVATFFSNHHWFLSMVIFAPVVAVVLKINTQKYFLKIHLPQLTFPFVLTSWLLFLIFPIDLNAHLPQSNLLELFFHSFSQIFLVGNMWSAILVLAGIAIGSRNCAYWSLLGALSSVLISVIFKTEVFGFSAVLTASALGGVFTTKKQKSFWQFFLQHFCRSFSIS